jgi:hypothetical protein
VVGTVLVFEQEIALEDSIPLGPTIGSYSIGPYNWILQVYWVLLLDPIPLGPTIGFYSIGSYNWILQVYWVLLLGPTIGSHNCWLEARPCAPPKTMHVTSSA